VEGHSDDKHQREEARLPESQSVIMFIAPPDRLLIYLEDPTYSILPTDFVIALRERIAHLEDRVTMLERGRMDLVVKLIDWAGNQKRKLESTTT
jgi:hypothetical protein